jgi:DNA (cytosine-5)-methyltransferase 1
VGISPTLKRKDGVAVTVPQPIAFHPTQDPIHSSDGTIHTRGCGSSGGYATGAVAIPFDTTQITSPLNRSSPRAGDTGHPLAAQAHPPAVALEGAQRTGDGTLSARTQGGGGLGTDCELDGGLQPVGAMAVRRLTPTETARLQGFPDDWNAHGLDKNYRQVLMKDGNRYKQMGNAVTVNVAHAIAERVATVLRKGEP